MAPAPSSNDGSIFAEKFELIKSKMGYEFKDYELMKRAVKTRDYCEKNEAFRTSVKDPLAMLGDSIIRTLVIKRLMAEDIKTAGDINDEAMKNTTREAQALRAKRAYLEKIFVWSNNEEKSHSWNNKKALGECLDMLIGAIYLDSNSIDACEKALDQIKFFRV
ncbi:MAG: ribonuclease III [Methanomassiliicoccales archaeon PtaU1.Bin124]|nr:MAG: ribonuclease III [Methanomassiliicoccales archaeon PtaU1.Bin124]